MPGEDNVATGKQVELGDVPGGYAGKWLEVDLTTGKMEDITFPREVLEQYLGGRGMATKILWDRLGEKWADLDALSP